MKKPLTLTLCAVLWGVALYGAYPHQDVPEQIAAPKEAPKKVPKLEPQPEPIDLSGYYSCVSSYKGVDVKMETVVTIRRIIGEKRKYRITWFGSNNSHVGIGVLKGNVLRVGVAMDKGYPGYAEYEVSPHTEERPRQLIGTWVNSGGEEGTETLTFLKSLQSTK